MIKWIFDIMFGKKSPTPMEDINNHDYALINPSHKDDRDKLKGNSECHYCTKRLTTWNKEFTFQRCVCVSCAALTKNLKEMDMLPLTEKIEELKSKNINTYKPGDMDQLRILMDKQKEQSALGGPVRAHHDIKSRSKK